MIKKFFNVWREARPKRVNKLVIVMLVILGAFGYFYINSKAVGKLELFGSFHISVVDIMLLIVAVSFYIYAKRIPKSDGKKSHKVGKAE